jgi:DUF4097 and DUF4098 domain-containing protein YvlB
MKPTSSRRTAAWAGAILGAFFALVLNTARAHAWNGDDNDASVSEEFHHTYPLGANGRIDLANINGDVRITAWDQNQVKVDAVKRAHDQQRLKDVEIHVEARNDSISIETRYHNEDDEGHFHNNPGSVEYTLMVPRTARLDEIKLINGALELKGVQGEVRASCVNGRLSASGLGGDARLATVNGKLEANFEHAARVELSSVNGSIDLTLPSDAKARIAASTVHGGIDNDFGLHTNSHRWVGHNLQGELGGGGPEITLSDVNGRIDIHHAADGRTLSPAKDTGERDEGTV